MLINEAVILPLSYGMQHWLVKPWVKNYPLSPSEGWFLKEVIIEPH
jgi:ABC-type transport system substrate-binding protein